MKILWVCNVVLPEFCNEFSIRAHPSGGWMSGFLNIISNIDEFEIGFCFPIIDSWRHKDGILGKFKYYSFSFSPEGSSFDETLANRFKEVLINYNPDVIHIWGTEFPHSSAAYAACESLGLQRRVIIDIQGLIYYISKYHFNANLPCEYLNLKSGDYLTLSETQNINIKRGLLELDLLKKAYNVFGRTEWDKECVRRINPDSVYYSCNRMLRPMFYDYVGQWSICNSQRYSIFTSQAHSTYKGLHYIFQAAPMIINIHPETHFYITGDDPTSHTTKGITPYGAYLSDLIKELDLSEHITFLGRLDEKKIIERFLKSHIFVSAASIENNCNSVTEAKLLGVPVVCSYVGGMFGRINHEEDGFLYQHDAPYMMASYICRIFEDDELASKFSENAVKSTIPDTDRDTISMYIMAVYRTISGASINHV